ncbi:MAG: hypothetical protein QOD77_1398 [Thermoplasmata archaeon]|jgi:PAS domain S-box-containing protein|nr:hypothetical protein [Thermoplasmata archaeon]
MHKLLERQLRRAFGGPDGVPPGLQPLLDAIDATYRGNDEDRALLERSMELTSQELLALNDELRGQRDQQRVIFDSVPALIFYKDTENRILRLNAPAAAVFGAKVEDIEGKSTYDLMPHDAAKRLHDDDLEVVRSAQPKLGILESHPDGAGNLRWARTDKVPYRDAAGKVAGVLVLSQDITERRRAEAALRESERRYRLIVETATEGIWSVDTEGRTTYANAVLAQMLAVTPEEIQGRNVLDFIGPDDRAAAESRLARLFAGGSARMDLRFRRGDGAVLWTQASGSAIRDGDGKVVGALGMLTDITKRREAEEELRAAYTRLQQVDQSRIHFLNTAAHELGTPLTPLVLQMRVLKGMLDAAPPETRRSLAVVERSVQRLQSLVQDLLDAARLESGQLRMNLRDLDATLLAHQAAESFAHVARQARVTLDVQAKGRVAVRADPARLGQVLDNLVGNALKFTPAGGRVVVRAEADGDAAVVSVADTGIGIPADAIPKLFQPFSQVHDPMKVNASGTGLGLYISKAIVEALGGKVEATSAGAGRGTTVTLRLPLVQVEREHLVA